MIAENNNAILGPRTGGDARASISLVVKFLSVPSRQENFCRHPWRDRRGGSALYSVTGVLSVPRDCLAGSVGPLGRQVVWRGGALALENAVAGAYCDDADVSGERCGERAEGDLCGPGCCDCRRTRTTLRQRWVRGGFEFQCVSHAC